MHTRLAAVAGQFYPSDSETLRDTVAAYLDDAQVSAAPEQVSAIVSPHAGYVYSGATAGYAFARIRGKTAKRVILLGRSHRYTFPEPSIYEEGVFETPLGTLSVDTEFARALCSDITSNQQEPHLSEHSLEVQLPFLQVAVGEVPIVPILFGNDPSDWHIGFGRKIADMLDEDDLVIASTDLSHYLSETEANKIDRHSLDQVLGRDCEHVISEVAAASCSMCGATAVVTAMACALARGAEQWSLLDYRTSGQASGDYSRVVGYGAISMEYGES